MRSTLAIALGVWLVLLGPPPALAQVPAGAAITAAQQRMSDGERLRAEGRFREALAAFEDAYRLHPSEAAQRAVAELHRALEDYAGAYAAYESLLRQHQSEMSEASQRAAWQALGELDRLTVTIAFVGFEPGATAAIDGVVVGTTPLVGAARVNPGYRTITVSKPGFRMLTRVVEASSGAVAVSGPLQPQSTAGEVWVSVDLPVVAALYVDGALVGNLPWRGRVALGDHVFQAVGPAYQSEPARVTVLAEPQSVRLVLRARPAQVEVYSGDPGARISIDGWAVGYGQWQGQLAFGQHRLRIELPGYQPHDETFMLEPGARLVLDRRDHPRPAGFTPPETPGPDGLPAERPPEVDDDSVGVYGAVFAAGTFGTTSTHQYASECPVQEYDGSCSVTVAKGGGIGLRLGYSLGLVGIEGLLIGGADVSFARAELPVTLGDPVLQRFAEESSYVRTGWAPGLGLRLTSLPAALRATVGASLAYAFHSVHAFPDSLEGDTSLSYSAPVVAFDGGILLGSTPGAKFYVGMFVWIELSDDVTLERNVSALGSAAELVPPELAQVDVYQGTQVFWGPRIGIGFGH